MIASPSSSRCIDCLVVESQRAGAELCASQWKGAGGVVLHAEDEHVVTFHARSYEEDLAGFA